MAFSSSAFFILSLVLVPSQSFVWCSKACVQRSLNFQNAFLKPNVFSLWTVLNVFVFLILNVFALQFGPFKNNYDIESKRFLRSISICQNKHRVCTWSTIVCVHSVNRLQSWLINYKILLLCHFYGQLLRSVCEQK